MRAKACLLALLLVTAATAGCAEYKYYDISVVFNTAPMMFNATEVSRIQNLRRDRQRGRQLRVLVRSGGRTVPRSPPAAPPTGAPSNTRAPPTRATMTFTFRAYVGAVFAECLVGEGSTSVTVGATTAMGTLTVNRVSDITTCNRLQARAFAGALPVPFPAALPRY